MQICLVSSFKVFRCLSLPQALFVCGALSALPLETSIWLKKKGLSLMEHYFPGKRRRFGLFFISKMSHNHI